MNAGRWYPTTTTLGNGDVLVVSGSMDDTGAVDQLPQVWQTGSGTWRNLTGAVVDLPLYPQMYVAPNGNVYNVAPNQTTTFINTSGTGARTNVVDRNVGYRQYSTSVLYDTGKILLVGGGDPPTAAAEVIDLTAPHPMWRTIVSMAFARKQAVATLLPDAKVLVTGGSSGPDNDNASFPVYAAEVWDPLTEQWTTLASEAMYRGYHSTATLLPDGRLASAGGDYSGANAEIFSPPYLFNGTRPTITSVPSRVGYGQTFDIPTPNAANIAAVLCG